MEMKEAIARRLCKYHGVDPDAKGYGVGNKAEKGTEYFLWEYWLKHYVEPVILYLEDESEIDLDDVNIHLENELIDGVYH